jgi:hypothetical protein
MSDARPIRSAIEKLEDLPRDQVQAGVAAKAGGDVGAFVEAQKDIGRPGGWTLAAAGEWMRRAGWSAAGVLRWKRR